MGNLEMITLTNNRINSHRKRIKKMKRLIKTMEELLEDGIITSQYAELIIKDVKEEILVSEQVINIQQLHLQDLLS